MLRIGLFVPAEWNFGGVPAWLHCIPTMVFWTDNEPFKNWLKFGRMAALCECLARFARVAVVVMEFIVYVEYELSHIPQAYLNDGPGTMTFVEPHQVEWWTLADVLSTFGYKGNADVYYIKPGCILPEGMVELLGQDDVDKLMHDHEGLKKCDLIAVKNYPCSDDDMNGQDMYGENMYGCDFLDTGNDRYLDMNRQDIYEETRDPCESPDRTERDSNEDGSSPRKKKRGRNNPKKSLDFGSSDEPLQ